MANIFDKLGDWFDTSSSTDYTKQALLLNALNANKAQEDIESVDTKTDDVRTLANKARETAGQAAGDKAAIAKKAASAMQGGSKLLNAINASSAAANAATEGYDEAQNRAMNLEASRQQSDVANRLNKATNKANARMNAMNSQAQMLAGMDAAKDAAKQKDWDRMINVGTKAGEIIAAAYSDADTKDFFKRMVK